MTDNGRGILVTGAASGIGAALARRVASPGVSLVLHTRGNRAKLEVVAEEVRALGAAVTLVLGDLADSRTALDLVAAADALPGGLTALVANAGFADKTPIAELSDAGLERSLKGIVTGLHRLVRGVLPSLKAARESGRLVTVGSFVAHVFRGNIFAASAAAKAGVVAYTRAVAAELSQTRGTANIVVPGYIQKEAGAHRALDEAGWRAVTERIPLGRLGSPNDVAAAIDFLLCKDAGYITGQALHVDGGLTL
ncbi:MAG: SDR family oxidoreductase [Alphaproteobacteria bacterium]|nr:SDR family oxidoreductase [Alphaproteobacteria bacterium]